MLSSGLCSLNAPLTKRPVVVVVLAPPTFHARCPSDVASIQSSLLVVPSSNFKMALTLSDLPKFICAVILPPIGVFLEKGCSYHLAINILLTLLGFIPGIIHACYVILAY
ncbi:unnamed protein product [Caenorhabditis auriculariae]|uniref:Plasma membrane proteolipid 3 n=1 Tax=Caenorhabditis auriculariae TaxID=2777116 RepID=A0A8S1GPJ1_9PELO|nr:unnamed protein product [Caenorhabditis auriculariae]